MGSRSLRISTQNRADTGYILKQETDLAERNILRSFFEMVCSAQQPDHTISDSKAVRDTKNKLKVALRNVPQRCTCSKRTWGGPREVCQGSDRELVDLRNFFRMIRNAKKHNMTTAEIQEFIENTQNRIVRA